MDTAMYILAEAAELVVGQADSTGLWGPRQRALTEKVSERSVAAAHFSDVMALPLSPSHSFVMPSAV